MGFPHQSLSVLCLRFGYAASYTWGSISSSVEEAALVLMRKDSPRGLSVEDGDLHRTRMDALRYVYSATPFPSLTANRTRGLKRVLYYICTGGTRDVLEVQ